MTPRSMSMPSTTASASGAPPQRLSGGPGRALGPSGESLTNREAALLKARSTPQLPPAPPPRGPLPAAAPSDVARVDALLAGANERAATVRSPFLPKVTLTNDQDWHLARRIAPAAGADVVAQIKAAGRSAWLTRQLSPAGIADPVSDTLMASLPAASMRASQAVLELYGYDYGYKIAPLVIRATWLRRLFSKRYLLESMVEFWHDLLHVTAQSDKAAYWIGDYDTYVIRANALGKFSTMLAAATTHGAMLDYLDNSLSTKDAPNENLGRELLELHTLGAGNFTEDDVKATTMLLTGWYGDWGTMTGRYEPANHHTGALRILGTTYPNATAASGPATLTTVLNRLARHCKTALRICSRLAIRFVADKPPSTLVNKMVNAYLANGTAIAPVLRVLFTSPEFAASVGKKWRRPSESLASMVGALRPTALPIDRDAATDNPYDLVSTDMWMLDNAGHLPLNWPPPDGYPDVAAAWMHTNGMLGAWNFGESVVWDSEPDYRRSPATIVFGITGTMTPRAIADRLFLAITGFPGDASARTMLARYLWSGDPFGALPPTSTTPTGDDRLSWYLQEAVRMVFSSPYFQIR